jgi:hypothetical protein
LIEIQLSRQIDMQSNVKSGVGKLQLARASSTGSSKLHGAFVCPAKLPVVGLLVK